MAARRKTFEELGGFDERLRAGEDVDLCLRAAERGLELRFAPDALVHCRLRTTMPALLRQGVKYGAGGAHVDEKYRARGKPLKSPLAPGHGRIHFVFAPLRSLLSARSQAEVAQVVFLIGRRIGYIGAALRPYRGPT